MRIPMSSGRRGWAAAVAVVALLAGGTAAAESVVIPVNGSKLLDLAAPVGQISVSASKIIDVRAVGERQILVTAKGLGQSDLTVWDKHGRARHYRLDVVVPLSGLADRLAAALPGEKITVQPVGQTLVLAGQVSDPQVAERAQRLAEAHLKGQGLEPQVLNFLTIRGHQQVQLRVKVAEVSRSGLREVGMNLWHRSDSRAGGLLAPGMQLNTGLAPELGTTGSGLQVGGTMLPGAGSTAPLPLMSAPFASDAFGLLFSTGAGSAFPLSLAVSLLQQKGIARVLSEPTLVAYSGQTGKFLSGGEFPIPIPMALGQTAIEFKKFGVQLSFTPTVLRDETIHLSVAVAVSDKDHSGAVQIGGTSVPGLSTRSTETTVRLRSGQSFAIAGLLQDRVDARNSQIPLLGDLPLVGLLFRESSFRRTESELVVLVTAELIRPLNANEVPALPGEDEVADPGAFGFFLTGQIESSKRTPPRHGPAGPVGFDQ